MAFWVHCMRYVPEDGITAGELARRTRLTAKSVQMIVRRMSTWWGYLTVAPDPADARVKPPLSDWVVRPTRAGRRAQGHWEQLDGMIERRWRARFGDAEIEQLRVALSDIVSRLDLELPDYLPIGKPQLRPRSTLSDDAGPLQTLPALMSKVLLAFALDFERESALSVGVYSADGISRLAISANILRVIEEDGVRVADIPALSGVAKMAVDNWLSGLREHHYLVIEPDAAGSRHRLARLTPKGHEARDAFLYWTDTIEPRWEDRFGKPAILALRDSIARLVVEPAAESPLWRGIEPYPDGWRAHTRRPTTLPHYPVISARGGFPDGS